MDRPPSRGQGRSSPLRRLESQARRIAFEALTQPCDDEIALALAAEIGSALERLDKERALFLHLRDSIVADECIVGSDLALIRQMSPPFSKEELALKKSLLSLASERRRLALQEAEALQRDGLELLSLVQRYNQVVPLDEDR